MLCLLYILTCLYKRYCYLQAGEESSSGKKQACCPGCRRKPFPMQLQQLVKSNPSLKWPKMLNQWCNFDALWYLESSLSLWHSLFITGRATSNRWAWWRRKAVGTKGWLTEWISDECVCRAAPWFALVF